MKYYKLLDKSGKLIRLDSAEINVSGGEEITKEEYDILLLDIKKDIKPLSDEELDALFNNSSDSFFDMKQALSILGVE